MTLHLKLKRGRWWILGHLDGPIGPYDTKGEAEDDWRGLERFERHGDKPGYVSSDRKKGKQR